MGSSSRRAIAFRFWRVAMPAALLLTAFSLLDTTRRLEAFSRSPFPLVQTLPYSERLAMLPPEGAVAAAAVRGASLPVSADVERGETLGGIFRELGLADTDAVAAASAVSKLVDVRRIKPGCRYSAYYSPGAGLCDFELALAEEGRLKLSRTTAGWEGILQPYERRTETRRIAGDLQGDLEGSIRRAGGDPAVTYRMADVLEWDLDFNRDLRAGDAFSIVYENVLVDGRQHSVGNILALTYVNRGKQLEAYRYGTGGYYDAEGRPLRKMFLRSPMAYSRVTSRFSNRRFHPVLKAYRPHYGVDYGAPTGTPARVTASGVVEFVGWDRGGGKTVKVRHGQEYLTAYLHLSGYGPGVRKGARVSQGDIIGYVGATGLATGPHLDYRVQRRGQWIDPLTLGGQPAEALSTVELASFRSWRDDLRASLRSEGPVMLTQPAPQTVVAAAKGVATARDASAGATARR